MSKYSGKCDFRDDLELSFHDDWDEFKARAEVYHYINNKGDKEKLVFNAPADLIPWYTHIIAIGAFEKDGPCTIVLSKNSYLDEQIKSFKRHKINTEYLEHCKCDLISLYEKEKIKPYDEQRII